MDTTEIDAKMFIGFDTPVLAHLGQKPEMALYETDDDDNIISIEDSIALIEVCRVHFEKVGLGDDFVRNVTR